MFEEENKESGIGELFNSGKLKKSKDLYSWRKLGKG